MNESQIEAVTSRRPHVLVSAGAGSGKTRVLTERYFRLITDEGVNLDDILTLTFTRKAAQEMRSRIAQKLEAEGRIFELRKLSRAPIGTMHSFCEGLLRTYALDAGIDPNFRLLDEAEARTLQDEVLDMVFDDLWNGVQVEREEMAQLMLDYPQRTLREALLEIYRNLRIRGLTISDLSLPALSDATPLGLALLACIEELFAVPPASSKTWPASIAEARQALPGVLPILRGARQANWDDYVQIESVKGCIIPAGGPRQAKGPRDAANDVYERWKAVYLEHLAKPYLSAMSILLSRFDAAFRAAKDTQALLDFEDLLLQARLLLTGKHANRLRTYRYVMVDEFQDTNALQFSIIAPLRRGGHLFTVGDVKQAIYRFIGSDVEVFLNYEQQILDLPEHDAQRIPMLTNYRSRREVLEPLNYIFSHIWGAVTRDDGFRFEPLDAGLPFLPKATPSIECAFHQYDRAVGASELRDREAHWIARRILQLTGRIGDTSLEITRTVAGDGDFVGSSADYRDVIILFRASSEVPRYEAAFREAGIPYYVVSGRGFYQTAEVQDFLHLLRVLENPMDDFSLTVVLRSPLVGISDDCLYWLARDWQEWSDNLPYPARSQKQDTYGRLWSTIEQVEDIPAISDEDRQAVQTFRASVIALQAELPAGQPLDLIDHLLARTRYDSILLAMDDGEQRYANLQKLRELAGTFQARGIFDITDFQRYLSQLEQVQQRESSAPLDTETSNSVRLMTIHAAKGLEAPIVFMADCGYGGPSAKNEQHFSLGLDNSLVCKVPTPDDTYEKTAGFQQARAQHKEAERLEAERLLYVGMTRAREHLICSGFLSTDQKDTAYSRLLCSAMETALPETDDLDIVLTYDQESFQVRLWSQASLAAIEALRTPSPPATLWEGQRQHIARGGELPLLTDAAVLTHYERIVDRLQPPPPMRREGPMRIGVHRLLGYDTCPRQYWFRYVLQQEVGATERHNNSHHDTTFTREADRIDSDAAYGTLMHAVLQLVRFDRPLVAQVAEALERLRQETGVETSTHDADRIAMTLARLESLDIFAQLRRAETVFREQRFILQEHGVIVPGIIDVLAETDGAWWILDYKTGHYSPSHLRQVALYASGVIGALGVSPSRMVVVYLHETDPTRMVQERQVTPALLEKQRQLIRDVADGIQHGKFHPTPGRQCRFCAFASGCPDAVSASGDGMLI